MHKKTNHFPGDTPTQSSLRFFDQVFSLKKPSLVVPPRPPHRLPTEPARKAEAAASFSVGGESEKGARSAPFHPSMAMIRDLPNPRPLHNFSLPRLRWGKQKHLLCVKEYDHSSSSSSSSSSVSAFQRRSAKLLIIRTRFAGAVGDGDGIDAVREKLVLDLRMETDKIKEEPLKDNDEEVEEEEEKAEVQRAVRKRSSVAAMAGRREEYEADKARPWNLRARRAACKAPASNHSSLARNEEVKASPEKQKERETFAVALKRNEIEEDFWRLTRHRPPRRPKKRLRTVQKHLDMLFLGLWLTEISSDTYKVEEVPDNAKT